MKETNQYHAQTKDDDEKWRNAKEDEVLAFIGVTIAIGIVRLPEMSDYWCRQLLIQTPWFGKICARNRYIEILRYLHLTDNEKAPEKQIQSTNLVI